jgi:hypothetical protein
MEFLYETLLLFHFARVILMEVRAARARLGFGLLGRGLVVGGARRLDFWNWLFKTEAFYE